MKETKRTYEREFKLEALRLLEASGESAAQIERDLGITPGLLSRWKRQMAARDEQAFPGRGRLTPDQEHVRQLERENELLRQERDILKKAVAIFSRPSK
jgi:transposase